MSLKNNLLLKKILSEIAAQPLRWIRNSWRVEDISVHPEAQALLDEGAPVIYALWHGRMYCLLKAVPPERIAILVSPSNDGEFITRIARRIGFRHFVRGSHKRGGRQAMAGMIRALTREGHSVAFTVDGPRGPRYEVKPGIIRLAAQTGAPIIPLGSATRRLLKKLDGSWDHYHAPLPGTGMRLVYGKPLRVPPHPDEEATRAHCKALEAELMGINLQADAAYGFHHRERL
jgi:lysophospholipid acyltransferase (LPLAT)-like uncharacterized protein